MFPYLRGSGEETGWLSMRLSCGDSCGRHTRAVEDQWVEDLAPDYYVYEDIHV